MGARTVTPPLESSSPMDSGIRKRVCKACDRCRLKKSKCDGATPCGRCKADNAICVFGERKKSHDKVYPKGYVEMLENQQAQLVTGLQELYKRVQSGQGWTGAPLKDTTHGAPLTHDILERLGALKQDSHDGSEMFEEDLNLLQQRLIANGAVYMKRDFSQDDCSETSQSPTLETVPSRPLFSNPFALNQLPPTPPPSASPFQRSVRSIPNKPTSQPRVAPTSNMNMSWSTPLPEFDDHMDFSTFDSPMMDTSMDMSMDPSMLDLNAYAPQMFQQYQLGATAINPCLTMKDWSGQEEMPRYFSPAMSQLNVV